MEKKTFSSSVSAHKEASNYDEIFMRHSLLFTENLKDLKNIRKQLHTAADYFELSYGKDDQKQLMLETLKDYIAKAIVNTVDHLGSVAYKVNTFLDEKVNEMSKTEIQFSCIEQRIQISREISDHCGRSQQSFLIKTAKHHKQYMIPEKILGIGKTKSVYTSCSPCAEYDSYRSKNGKILSSIADAASSPETFSFTTTTAPNEELEEATISSQCFPLKRSGSLISSPITPNSSNVKQQYLMQLRRSASVSTHVESNMTREIQPYSKKSKPLYKALLSIMLKQKRDRKNNR